MPRGSPTSSARRLSECDSGSGLAYSHSEVDGEGGQEASTGNLASHREPFYLEPHFSRFQGRSMDLTPERTSCLWTPRIGPVASCFAACTDARQTACQAWLAGLRRPFLVWRESMQLAWRVAAELILEVTGRASRSGSQIWGALEKASERQLLLMHSMPRVSGPRLLFLRGVCVCE